MKQLLDGIKNEDLLTFTNALADFVLARQDAARISARTAATFKGDDLKITDANRQRVQDEAVAQAKAYSESRNRHGTSPRSAVGATEAEKSIQHDVRSWIERSRRRMKGGK